MVRSVLLGESSSPRGSFSSSPDAQGNLALHVRGQLHELQDTLASQGQVRTRWCGVSCWLDGPQRLLPDVPSCLRLPRLVRFPAGGRGCSGVWVTVAGRTHSAGEPCLSSWSGSSMCFKTLGILVSWPALRRSRCSHNVYGC